MMRTGTDTEPCAPAPAFHRVALLALAMFVLASYLEILNADQQLFDQRILLAETQGEEMRALVELYRRSAGMAVTGPEHVGNESTGTLAVGYIKTGGRHMSDKDKKAKKHRKNLKMSRRRRAGLPGSAARSTNASWNACTSNWSACSSGWCTRA